MKKLLIKILNFINPFHRSVIIHFTNRELIPIYENVTLKHIPSIGDKAFFKDQGDFYYVIDVVYYYNNHSQLIYIVIERDI